MTVIPQPRPTERQPHRNVSVVLPRPHFSTLERAGCLAVPRGVRGTLGTPFALARVMDAPHLVALPLPSWERLVIGAGWGHWQSQMLCDAFECVTDRASRFPLPATFRDHMDLFWGTDVAFIPCGEAVVLCKRAHWEDHLERQEWNRLDAIAQAGEYGEVIGNPFRYWAR